MAAPASSPPSFDTPRQAKRGAAASLGPSRPIGRYALAGRPRPHGIGFLTQARLPPGKFTWARLSILLEVMESRKVVAAVKGSSASVRWQLRA